MPRFLPVLAFLTLAAPAGAADLPADWAFKPYTRPAVPAVRGATRTPVDAFILARLEAEVLTLAPAADRRTLIRRLTFDLHGLPPTPEEVAAFVADAAPDAYEKLVDRLLASPRYGERLALFWLDLARYAESDGFKSDDPRPDAWRYRDYVIRALNNDKPFDRFIREQLAGDELFPDDPDALTATGFLRHYPYEYNAVDVEPKRQDILNDLTDTTAAAFLGLTLGCAKCHDHKTDPVTQEDYYRVQAFFAGFWPVEAPLLPAAARRDHEAKRTAWEGRTAAERAELAKLEEPYRQKEMTRNRLRFPADLLALVDTPAAERTPLQKQVAAMVERQVLPDGKDMGKLMKGDDKAKWDALTARVAAAADRPADPPRAPAMTDTGPTPPPTFLLKRGNWKTKGDEVVPGFIASITEAPPAVRPTANTSGRRAALAGWIADAKNPLTARVAVNRAWQHHFGVGLVASASDFGVGGDRPTRPELLDWLASEFVGNGWSLKRLHRLIVTSAVYRQAARGGDAAGRADPDNVLLSHAPRRRLDGEALRDAVLATAGVLNPKAGGPGVYPELPAEVKAAGWKVSADPAERNRRSVYVAVKRNLRYPFFSLFDSPERVETCARRFSTTTAPQALTLLNDTMILGHAKSFAARVTADVGTDDEQVIARAFELALSRPPTTEEAATLLTFLRAHPGPAADARTDLCHALLNLNEFLYVD